MNLPFTAAEAQQMLKEYLKARRLQQGLTQQGLASRAGVSVSTLRKYEQKGVISHESFLKLLMVLGGVRGMLDAIQPLKHNYRSMQDVLSDKPRPKRARGWRQ